MRSIIATAFGSAIQSCRFNSSVANRRIRVLAHNKTNKMLLLKQIEILRSSNFVEEVIAEATVWPKVLDLYRFVQIKWNTKSQQSAEVNWAAWELELVARAYVAQRTAEHNHSLLK